ncbi:MAG: acyl-CoA/acyl-ACP dehydrogenase [Porticoccaceae bacterium]|nr:acyl-CoA/acyl-ACP dehydrogenase [Porticoccaceae bacterium]
MALVHNQEHQMLKESAQGFLREFGSITELRKYRDSEEDFSPLLWPQMVEMGWAAILIPESHGGLGFGQVGMGQIVEQSGRMLTASPLLSTAILGASIINLAGSEEQKAQLLPAVASGQLTTALAVDESAHHAPNNIGLAAEKTAVGFRLTGSKRSVVDGHRADLLIVAARSSGSLGDSKGVSLFLVESKAAGVSIEKMSTVDGRSVANISFDGVEVATEALLGDEELGFRVLSKTLDIGNAHLAAELLGICSEAFERTLQYLKERQQFGVSIGSFQALQHRAAHWWSEIELAKSLVLKCFQALDADDIKAPILVSISKAKLCEVADLSTNEAIQMHGGVGMTDEYDIGFFIKRARPVQALFGGYSYHSDRFASMTGY